MYVCGRVDARMNAHMHACMADVGKHMWVREAREDLQGSMEGSIFAPPPRREPVQALLVHCILGKEGGDGHLRRTDM